MKKKIPLIIFLLICSNVFSQIYRLEYKFGNNIPRIGYQEYKAYLDYNNKTNESIYTVLLKLDDNQIKSIDDGFILDEGIIDNVIIYNNFKDSITITQDQIDIEMLLFEEKTPHIKWDLINESKIKNNLKLNKAKTSFRGRNYEVWYTSDIPEKIGPWKLNGLPGAIVEIKEDQNRYSWELIKFYKVDEKEFKNPLNKSSYNKHDIKDYPKLKFETSERIKEKLRKIDSNFRFPPLKRSDIELKFEWEK